MLKIKLIEKKYQRTLSGKSWSTKNIVTSESYITMQEYNNYIDSMKFFRNLGGWERGYKNYTSEGYIVTNMVSISPDREEKVTRHFDFIREH